MRVASWDSCFATKAVENTSASRSESSFASLSVRV